MKRILFGSASAAMLLTGTAAFAQDNGDWTGAYFGGRLGYSTNVEDEDETVLFDTNLDGEFGDTVATVRGSDAFSPGFCGGRAASSTATTCRDSSGTEWAVHAGYDFQIGNSFVVGIVGDYGRADVQDAVTAFSTTPAFYTLERDLDDIASIRARAGVALGRTLFYGTGGAVYAKVRSSFTTSNGVNTFTSREEEDDTYGYRVGGGVEHRFGERFSLGVQYLYTTVEDEDFRVRAGGANVPVSNPFILVNADGTDFQRSDGDFDWHNLSVTASFRF